MSSRHILKIFIPSAAIIAETKVNDDKTAQKKNECRPSELPIYVAEQHCKPKQSDDQTLNAIENAFATARQSVTKVFVEVDSYRKVGIKYFDESKENTQWLINYLQQEDNTTPKAGAIVIGGLTGFIFGLRGGIIKRTFYATTGALGIAAICYPKEAADYSQIGLNEAKKYATIAYNFVYGVKKDDPPLELPTLPALPTSLSEAWESVSKSASSFVSGQQQAPVEIDNKAEKGKIVEKK